MESSEHQKKLWRDAELEALAKIKEAGVQVLQANKDEFRDMVQPMYDEFKEDADMKKIIEEIQEAK